MVLVEQDSLTGFTQYLLGVGVDSTPAYRLLLGPESYVPVTPRSRDRGMEKRR